MLPQGWTPQQPGHRRCGLSPASIGEGDDFFRVMELERRQIEAPVASFDTDQDLVFMEGDSASHS